MIAPKIARAAFYKTYAHSGNSQSTIFKNRLPCVHANPQHLSSVVPSRFQFSTNSHNAPIEYHWIDGAERLHLYEPGGYHPVMVNDLLHNRYRIVDKLGFGGYATIWLAQDERTKRYVALKMGISGPSAPRRETGILKALHGSSSVSQTGFGVDARDALPKVHDAFEIRGPNGTHACYTMTPAQGNLREASFSRLFPVRVARALAAKLVLAVAFIHSRGYVHGDLHLRNVLVKLPSTFEEMSITQFQDKFGEPETVPITRVDGKPHTTHVPTEATLPLYLGKKAQDFTLADAHGLMLSDFGEAFSAATEQRFGTDCKIPLAKRAPEALFEPDELMSYPSDIWSLGTAVWEILGMKFIFSESETRDEIVAQLIDVLGGAQNFPQNWRKLWERSYEDSIDAADTIPRKPTEEREEWPSLECAFEEFVQKYRRKLEVTGIFGEEETWAILELIRGMLKFRPEERMTIEEVLRSKWMVDWALPELE